MYFIIVSGQPDVPDSQVSLFEADVKEQAHKAAAKNFREKRGLASNIHISTHTVFESNDEDEAVLFAMSLNHELRDIEIGEDDE